VEALAAPNCRLPLTSLSLSKCARVTGTAVHALAEGRPGLTWLLLDGCPKVTGQAVVHLATRCRHLETLRLSNNPAITLAHAEQVVARAPAALTRLGLLECGLSYTEMYALQDKTNARRARAAATAAAATGGAAAPIRRLHVFPC